MAEAFERSRYEQLRGGSWAALRESERETRTEVARRAFVDSGIADLVADLAARAARTDEVAGLLAQRDAELSRRVREHDAALIHVEAQLATAHAGIAAGVAAVRSEMGEAGLTAVLTRASAVAPSVPGPQVPARAGAPTAAPSRDEPQPLRLDDLQVRPAASRGLFGLNRLARGARQPS